VLSGVSEGEEVVVSGQFLIDSEASLSGVLARLSQQGKVAAEVNRLPMDNVKPTAVEKMPKGHGKVVEVDAMSGKLILNHEPIAELGWPAMTMGFKVKESKQLEKLKVGDAVTFDLKAEASEKPDMPAQYRVERIEKVAAMQDGMKGAKP
jgi:Cu(I)/Ag(I) efflux system membrane fusion protein